MKNALFWGIFVLLLTPVALAAELTQISVHAPSVSEGDPLTLTYTLVDDNVLGQVTTDTYLIGGINHKTIETVYANTYRHQETFILPRSYNGQNQVQVRISVPGESPILRNIPISEQTQSQTTTQTELSTYQPESGVQVVVDPVRDVLRGDNVYYRARIINTNDQPKTVQIGLSDVGDWATYRVDPEPVVQLGPQEVHDAYIYLKVDPNAPAGTQYFEVTANYDGMQESAGVRIAVLQQLQTNPVEQLRPYVIAIALILLILALIYVIAAYLKKGDDDNDNGGDDDDFITYY